MKKIFMSVLTASVILGASTVAFAAGDTTITSSDNTQVTQTQTQDQTTQSTTSSSITSDQFYSTVYMDKMTTIVDLRAQTKVALDANKAIEEQIKNGIKAYNTSGDIGGQVKTEREKVKNDITQTRMLVQQRNTLRKQFQAAIKANDSATMKSIEPQIQALTSQIDSEKKQVDADKAALQPLVDQLKTANNARKQKLQQLQPLIQQNKDLHQKIVQEETAKNQLWKSYSDQIKARDFTSAGNTLQSIIDAKTQIIKDIKANGDILNQLLNAINSLNGTQQSTNTTQQ
ncbi:hypothetical protein [Clostridium sp. OS1-26]|uniref:hypothetical protein n=1 Tax=Clostridium sp. OS1-26 TaxID=3070681 RepID=UPI0027E12281|nr:hypothetical protein [Clostridium sp. OS1-26]WML33091.1 hypothetical protein RCG18_17255 [Clostridium sp. OS1-26]